MASMRSIGRMYPAAEPVKAAAEILAQSAPVLPASRSLPVRAHFACGHAEPETAYQIDHSTISTMVGADVPVDRAGAFAALAQRKQFMQAARRVGARGWQDFPAF